MKPTQYNSIVKPSKEVLLKEKGSKFFGYAFPVDSEENINQCLEIVKSKHPKARHFCYAWQLGVDYSIFKTNDDGEPSNSAGMPIYGQLKSFDITNCLIVVVRYFGGTKLGVGGLISAYKTTAKLSLEASKIKTYTINKILQIRCEYHLINEVMRLIKLHHIKIIKQELQKDCFFALGIPIRDFDDIKAKFDSVYGLSVKVVS